MKRSAFSCVGKGKFFKSEKAPGLLFLLLIMIALVVGRYTYKDYAYTVDEWVDRQTASINYQYVADKLFDKELNLHEEQLADWMDRYYGIALQLPMMVVEHLTGFTMPNHDAYALRHLYTFLVCMTGWVCYYLFLKKVFTKTFQRV